MSTDTFTLPFQGTDTTLSPAEIEQALVAMWKSPAGDADEGGAIALRVVLGNVIWIGTVEQASRVRPIIDKVLPKYPCRLFLLEYDKADKGEDVQAWVSAQCFVPQKGAPPVCGELIHLKFGPVSARHLRGSVAPLLLPDLQTVLWRNLGDVEIPVFADLVEYCDRVIGQVSLGAHPAKMLEKLVTVDNAFDLSWYRMTSIREQVAAYFDDGTTSLNLRAIKRIDVGMVKRTESQTLPELMDSLFVGWLGSRLGWKPARAMESGYVYTSPAGEVEVTCRETAETSGPVRNNMNQVDVFDGKGRSFHMALEDVGDEMDMWCGDAASGCHRHVMLSEFSEADALGSALNSGTDVKAFRAAAALAIPLLESLHP